MYKHSPNSPHMHRKASPRQAPHALYRVLFYLRAPLLIICKILKKAASISCFMSSLLDFHTFNTLNFKITIFKFYNCVSVSTSKDIISYWIKFKSEIITHFIEALPYKSPSFIHTSFNLKFLKLVSYFPQ